MRAPGFKQHNTSATIKLIETERRTRGRIFGLAIDVPSHHLAHHLTMCEWHRLPRLVAHLRMWVNSQTVIDRRTDIRRRANAAADWIGALAIRLAQHQPRAHAAAGEHHGITVFPMIAARVLVDARRAAEFA